MNGSLVLLAHMASNPDSLRRLVGKHGASGAVSVVRRDSRTSPATRAVLDSDPDKYMTALSAAGIRLISEAASEYPDELRELPDRPLWLFVRGLMPVGPRVSVVGSRRATRYGLDIADRIGRRVAEAGWPVVSGLAAGVDTAAHNGALKSGGETVAVLGSGIDVWYPRRNRVLGEAILSDGGAVISEFPPGTTPDPWRFPARNRIISGLSAVTIVCEAAVKSGALITARIANDHGRCVMAVPGDLSRSTSGGANLLIRDGAYPLTDLNDLIDDLELVMGPAPAQISVPELTPDGVAEHLGPTSVPIDEVAEKAGLPTSEVLIKLADLEMQGVAMVADGRARLI